jgi:hypothetical protein
MSSPSSDDTQRYLKAKESLRCTMLLGDILEMNENLNVFERGTIEEVIVKLTNMNYNDYNNLKEKVEPESISFDSGMRW